jgi:2,3-dihydroxy-p-cumate/2,3-dihydroxybenzoate 3,4-dioxygenase
MDRLYELGYVTLEVADLDAAVDFYARAIRLDVTERRPDVVFMGGGKEHHWLRLEKSTTPGISRVAYRAVDDAALEAIKADLDMRSIAYVTGGNFGLDRVDKWMRFTSPGGVPWELFTQMAELPTAVASNGVKMETLLHTLFVVPNFDEELVFCEEVLGFKISDMIENSIVFLRCGDGYHHSFGFARGPAMRPKAKFAHFCILVPTLDDVMLYRHNAKELGLTLEQDILKHPTSGSVGVYVKEPWHDFAIEFCVGHMRITDDSDYHWRNVSMGPGAIDIWKEPLPPPRVESKAPFYESLVDAAQDAL